jgi:hypothetical protein
MSDRVERVVVDLPVPPEERQRRLMVEVHRLADLSTVDWTDQLQRRAEEYTGNFGVSSAQMKALVHARLKDKAEERRTEQREEKQQKVDAKEKKVTEIEKQKDDAEKLKAELLFLDEQKEAKRKAAEKTAEFVKIQKSPSAEHESKLIRLAKRLDADIDELRVEFAAYVEDVISASLTEPWPEPIDTATILHETMAQFRRYVVVRIEGKVATTLWTLQAWVHNEIATHSPILAVTSVVPNSGKTTALGVLERMTPNAYSAVEMTGPNIYHIIDRLRPTLIIDEADRLFLRRHDIAYIVNASWTRGAKVPRLVRGEWHDFNIFSPKIIGTLGLHVTPQTHSRFIVIKLEPKMDVDDEKVEDFHYVDDETFVALRRKLMRWTIDNAAKLKDAKPEMPVGFSNRLGQNWRLLFAIAELAGGDWPKLAHAAAIALSHKSEDEAPEHVRLLAAAHPLVAGRSFIASAELKKVLNNDPLGEWQDFRGHGPISEKQIATLLGLFEIYPKVHHPVRGSTHSERGYLTEHFAPVFHRYLQPVPETMPNRTTVQSKRSSKKGRKK